MPAQRDVERIQEPVVLADALLRGRGDHFQLPALFAVAGRGGDRLGSQRQIFVGIRREDDTVGEIEAETSLEVGVRADIDEVTPCAQIVQV